MNFKKGFTLVELIIVIVILGILSVVVAPKFIDVQADATAANLKSLAAAVKETAKLQNLNAIIKANSNYSINGFTLDGITFDQGYPIGISHLDSDNIPEIIEAIDLDLSSYVYFPNRQGSDDDGVLTREVYITLNHIIQSPASVNDITNENCYVEYESYVLVALPPRIILETSGC